MDTAVFKSLSVTLVSSSFSLITAVTGQGFLRAECYTAGDRVTDASLGVTVTPDNAAQQLLCSTRCAFLEFTSFVTPGPDLIDNEGSTCRCCEVGVNLEDPIAPVRRTGDNETWRLFNSDDTALISGDFSSTLRVSDSQCRAFDSFGEAGLGVRFNREDCATDVGLIQDQGSLIEQNERNRRLSTFMWNEVDNLCVPCAPGRAGTDGGIGDGDWNTYTLLKQGKRRAVDVRQIKYNPSGYFGACEVTSFGNYASLQKCINMAGTTGCRLVTHDSQTDQCACCDGGVWQGSLNTDTTVQYNVTRKICTGGSANDCALPLSTPAPPTPAPVEGTL